jgi:hypothetical protein
LGLCCRAASAAQGHSCTAHQRTPCQHGSSGRGEQGQAAGNSPAHQTRASHVPPSPAMPVARRLAPKQHRSQYQTSAGLSTAAQPCSSCRPYQGMAQCHSTASAGRSVSWAQGAVPRSQQQTLRPGSCYGHGKVGMASASRARWHLWAATWPSNAATCLTEGCRKFWQRQAQHRQLCSPRRHQWQQLGRPVTAHAAPGGLRCCCHHTAAAARGSDAADASSGDPRRPHSPHAASCV